MKNDEAAMDRIQICTDSDRRANWNEDPRVEARVFFQICGAPILIGGCPISLRPEFYVRRPGRGRPTPRAAGFARRSFGGEAPPRIAGVESWESRWRQVLKFVSAFSVDKNLQLGFFKLTVRPILRLTVAV